MGVEAGDFLKYGNCTEKTFTVVQGILRLRKIEWDLTVRLHSRVANFCKFDPGRKLSRHLADVSREVEY